MKQIDFLQVVIVLNISALVLAGLTAIIIALNNAGSKNFPLGAAALLGVMVAYGIQLPFELVRSTTKRNYSAEMTIDRAGPVIRQWVYPDDTNGVFRSIAEVGASKWLTDINHEAFEAPSERVKAFQDLMLYSIMSYLAEREFDWQMQRNKYGPMESWQPTSKPNECTKYSDADLHALLKQAGNLFAEAPFRTVSQGLCLPPRTSLGIESNSISINNPFLQMTFTIVDPNTTGGFFVDPVTRTYVALRPQEPRYETRIVAIKAERTFFALRAQHRKHQQYEEWSSRIMDGLDDWFTAGNRNEPSQQIKIN